MQMGNLVIGSCANCVFVAPPKQAKPAFMAWLAAIITTKRLSLWASITSSIKGLQQDEVMTRCACERETEGGDKKRSSMSKNKMEIKKNIQETENKFSSTAS